MSVIARLRVGGPRISWRQFEWWGAGVSLFLQTGAVFPLLMTDASGDLGEPAKAKLRLLSFPVYVFSIVILARHRGQFLLALVRNLPFQLLIAMPLLSVLWSVSPSVTLRRAVGLLFTVLLAYVLAIRFTPRQILLLVMAVLGTCIVLSLMMLGTVPRLARMPSDGTIRGVFTNKNSLGWYAGILAFASAVIALDGTIGFRRSAMALLVASLVCLAGSTSMTAIISGASAAALLWFYSRLPRLHGMARAFYILVFLQISILLLLLLHEFLVPVLEALGKDATLTGRVPLWELVDGEIGTRPLLGFGYQAFWTIANPEAWAIWSAIGWPAPHAHNGFRDLLLSLGLAGLVPFVFVLLRAAYQGAALQCRAPEDGWLWVNAYIMMFLVMNMTESMFLLQNDCIFTLFATAITLISFYAPAYSNAPAVGGALQRQPPAEPPQWPPPGDMRRENRVRPPALADQR